ncbi:hypothetical protein ACWD4B_29630, partial [Streptomyces sp. NPDC002536]
MDQAESAAPRTTKGALDAAYPRPTIPTQPTAAPHEEREEPRDQPPTACSRSTSPGASAADASWPVAQFPAPLTGPEPGPWRYDPWAVVPEQRS